MQAVPLLLVTASGLVSAAIAWGLASGTIPAPMAHPDARTLHARAVPRTGGLAIWAGWAAGLAGAASVAGIAGVVVAASLELPGWTLLVPLLGVIAVSLIDDYRGLAPVVRIVVHVVAAVAVSALWLGGRGPMLLLEVLVIVWMSNLYNFMDGADGLAGAMGVAGFGAFAGAAWLSGQEPLAWTMTALGAACAGFLVFNRPTARLFMGDVGAVGLGFVAGAFGLRGWIDGAWPWWFPPLAFMPFIFDSTVTLFRRMRRRQPLALSHRDHFYQQAILRSGGRHGPTVARYALWMAASALAGLAALRWAPDFGIVLLVVLTLAFAVYCRTTVRPPKPAGAGHAG